MAILVVAAMPILSTYSDLDGKAPTEGTHAVYDLSLMDENALSDNISDATGGETGFFIEYGDAIEAIDPSGIGDLAARIVTSGADTAVVKDQSGEVAVQKSVIYRNALVFGEKTGILVPKSYTDQMSVDVYLRFRSDDGLVDHNASSGQTRTDGEISVGYVMPIVLYNIIGAHGCDLGLHMKVGYGSLAEAVVDIGRESIGFDYELTEDSGKAVLKVTGCQGSESGTGSIGDAEMSFSGGDGWAMTLSCEGKLSDVLRNSLKDGKLSMELNGDVHEMTAAESELLISVVRAMEGSE